MLPALVGQLVVVLKDSALGYDHHLPRAAELVQDPRLGLREHASPPTSWRPLLFIVINYLLTVLARYVERRLSSRGRTTLHATTAAPTPDQAQV